ncbi:tyrosine-protein phosphatase non-receptor type 18 [Mugil cephalus]|uniref:tyrosine-protein phosphatase non-receptor type 18 n=1 Tax=Mugil cephalus TaxID=48193 RepID=UPI001FB84665|nr:tyrosine-protein phosphatase non-receptor type 18 [Mugil cephalus]
MELLSSLLSTMKTLDPGAMDQEYSVVRSQTLTLKRELGLTTEAGALKENIKKNRYKDILPYDQTRVVLSPSTSDSDSDYINASFIQGATPGSCYIASQGPLSSTVTDFWRMIWQHHVKVIVMACREIEMGKRKCECYWAAEHQTVSFGPFSVSNEEETRPNEDTVIRALNVSFQQESRSLVHYQFLSWPDHEVPDETSGILDFLERVRISRRADSSPLLVDPSPLLVHCSAGCGRTGVFVALDYIHDLLVTKKISSDFSIMNIVLELRRQRPSAVQTKDQYLFIFTAVSWMLERFLKSSDRHLSQTKKSQNKKKTRGSSINRSSQQMDMNDTYAVVNKPKHAPSASTGPTHSAVAPPRPNTGSRTLPPSHHYDNDVGKATPIYSTVKPRVKTLSLSHSATPIYDLAAPSSHRPGSGPDYQLVSAEQIPVSDNDYEDFSSSDVTSFCSAGGIGFNSRVQKPRGPRDPPVEWSRLER